MFDNSIPRLLVDSPNGLLILEVDWEKGKTFATQFTQDRGKSKGARLSKFEYDSALIVLDALSQGNNWNFVEDYDGEVRYGYKMVSLAGARDVLFPLAKHKSLNLPSKQTNNKISAWVRRSPFRQYEPLIIDWLEMVRHKKNVAA